MSRISQPLNLEFILLGLIAEHPMHGYDLYKEINTDQNLSQIWSIKQSLLYAMLEKLEEMNLLHSHVESNVSYPARRVYHLTETGRQAFVTWRGSPVEHPREMRQEFLARLYFGMRESYDCARELLHRQLETCEGWVELHQQHAAETDGDIYERMVLDFKQAQIESMLAWVTSVLEGLQQ